MMHNSSNLSIEEQFTYHAPKTEERKAKHRKLNDAAIAFAKVIDEVVEDKESLPGILTQVQLARMLGNQAITWEDIAKQDS